jgi:GTP cyclohydrolase I
MIQITATLAGEIEVVMRQATARQAPAPAQASAPAKVSVLRAVPDGASHDLVAAELAAADFLRALGLRLDTESLRDTPRRMAQAYAELLTPREFNVTTFPNDEGYDELVLVRDIPIRSMCEHHLLPFVGVAHVGYLPGERIVGLSKLARVVELFAHGPQVQERLTRQVADWLDTHLHPRGVGVVIDAEHLCMTLRGVQATGTRTLTSTLLGTLREDARSRAEFLALTAARPH